MDASEPTDRTAYKSLEKSGRGANQAPTASTGRFAAGAKLTKLRSFSEPTWDSHVIQGAERRRASPLLTL